MMTIINIKRRSPQEPEIWNHELHLRRLQTFWDPVLPDPTKIPLLLLSAPPLWPVHASSPLLPIPFPVRALFQIPGPDLDRLILLSQPQESVLRHSLTLRLRGISAGHRRSLHPRKPILPWHGQKLHRHLPHDAHHSNPANRDPARAHNPDHRELLPGPTSDFGS